MVSVASANRGNVLQLMSLREVRDDCFCLKPRSKSRYQREYMAVIKVDPINFPLMSSGEQEAILEGFRSFLSSLSPNAPALSIHVRNRPYNLGQYLSNLDTIIQEPEISDLYKELAADHRQFIQSLASSHALIEREFYVRVPLLINIRESKYRRLEAAEVFDQARADLARRVAEIIVGLGRSGLIAHRLTSEELVYYYCSCIHTRNAEEYALPQSVLYSLDFPIKVKTPHLFHAESAASAGVAGPPTFPDEVWGSPGRTLQEAALDAALARQRKWVKRGQRRQRPRRWIWRSSKGIQAEQQKQQRRRQQGQGMAEPPEMISLPELIEPASVEVSPYCVKIHHVVGDEYLRGRAVIGYSAFALGGWFDQLLSIDEPYIDFLVFIGTVDSASYVRALTRNIAAYRATQHLEQRHGRTENPYIAAAREEVEQLRDELVRKIERVHTFSLYICTRAESRQTLKERDAKVASLLRSLDLVAVPLQYEHLQIWLSCVDGRDILRRVRKLDTSTIVAAFPFSSSNLSTEPGILVGLTNGGGLVIVDPTSDQLENGHELVFARSGAGKSYYRKIDLMRQLLAGFSACVIDPENEYQALCHRFGGTTVRMAPGNLQVNPFDLARVDGSSDRNVLEEKFQNLLVLFDLLLADRVPGVLSQREKGYLNRILTHVYADHGITPDSSSHDNVPPNMHEFYRAMQEDGDPFQICDRLLRYLPSFPERTGVALDNPLVVFNMRELSDELRPVALYLVTDYVWSQIRKDLVPRPTLLLIDEAWTLMAYPEGGRFLAGISRRARKYNLHLRLVTQNVEDFLGSEHGRTILLNSAMKFLMKQDSTTIDSVAKAFKLSDEERRFLLGATKGEGLFFCRSSHVPLRVVASELEHRLATTNPKELLELEQARHAKLAEAGAQAEQEAVAVKQSQNEYNVVLPYVYNAQVDDGEALPGALEERHHERSS